MVFSWEFLWLAVFAVGVIVEIITVGLTTIWFALGALVAFVAALLGATAKLQLVLFLVVTVATLFWTRPLAVKYLNSRRTATNVEATLGQRVRVIERIDNGAGTGKVNYKGMEWTARSVRDEIVFEVDDFARVNRIEGVKMIVESETGASSLARETSGLAQAVGAAEEPVLTAETVSAAEE